LGAENRRVRPHHIEELGDHRRHAAKVTGTRRPAEDCPEPTDLDRAFTAVRIDLSDGRVEHDVDRFFLQKAAVALEVARIALQILARAELRRIDEYRDDHAVAALFRFAHETEVSFVQRAHRRHERDAPAGAALGFRPALHLAHRLDYAQALRFTPRCKARRIRCEPRILNELFTTHCSPLTFAWNECASSGKLPSFTSAM